MEKEDFEYLVKALTLMIWNNSDKWLEDLIDPERFNKLAEEILAEEDA